MCSLWKEISAIIISFYRKIIIGLTKDYHWVMAAGIMCLYSQDNIQTLSTHSPTFVWEGRSEKEIRGILTMDNSTIGHFEVKARTQRKTNKGKLWCVGQFEVFCESYRSLSTFSPQTWISHLLKGQKWSCQIDSEFKPETFIFRNITFKSKRQLVKDIMIFHCHQNHGRKLTRNLVEHEGQQIEFDNQF